jgi:hypothetical protein
MRNALLTIALSCSVIGAACGISAVADAATGKADGVAGKWAAGFVLCHAAVLPLAAADRVSA